MPVIVPNFIALRQSVYEKSVTIFYTLHFFESSPIWVVMYSEARSINLPNFVDFVDGLTDKNHKRYMSPRCNKRISEGLMHVAAWYRPPDQRSTNSGIGHP